MHSPKGKEGTLGLIVRIVRIVRKERTLCTHGTLFHESLSLFLPGKKGHGLWLSNTSNKMRITFHAEKQKVEVHDPVPYFIGASNADWAMQNVLDYLWGAVAWHASWTTEVPVEEMLDTRVCDIAILGDFTCEAKIE